MPITVTETYSKLLARFAEAGRQSYRKHARMVLARTTYAEAHATAERLRILSGDLSKPGIYFLKKAILSHRSLSKQGYGTFKKNYLCQLMAAYVVMRRARR